MVRVFFCTLFNYFNYLNGCVWFFLFCFGRGVLQMNKLAGERLVFSTAPLKSVRWFVQFCSSIFLPNVPCAVIINN